MDFIYADNQIQFKADLKKFADLLDTSVKAVVEKVTLDMWAELVRKTPVDTGRARASWFVTEDTPSTEVAADPGKGGELGEPIAPVLVLSANYPVTWITNNLPYILPLNNGHSAQAPAGFVQGVVLHAEEYVRRAISGL